MAFCIFFICSYQSFLLKAQVNGVKNGSDDSLSMENRNVPATAELDFVEFMRAELKLKPHSLDTLKDIGLGPFITALPAAGYAIQSGYIGVIAVSSTFFTDHEKKKASTILSNFFYSQYHQYWTIINSLIYDNNLKLSFAGDWRYYQFPTNTFGLGSRSSPADITGIDYSYLKFHQVVLREIWPDFFLGTGYHLDHYSNIDINSTAPGVASDFQKYGYSTHSTSSGVSLDAVFDDRPSSVNPRSGMYASFMYRNNTTFLGSDNNWQGVVLDIRKYIPFPENSDNVLALWSYDNMIIKGNPPYLDLPYTAGDSYSNTERGYAMGRFRGEKYVYMESEYRYGILHNGLLSAVVFANAASFSDWPSNQFNGIIPGGGGGLRVKINRHSETNVALDYGFGIEGSRGFFFNVGEVF